MATKFIPNGDWDFAMMAGNVARHVARDPARFEIEPEDAAALSAAVARFSEALRACGHGNAARSPMVTRAKEDARADAERLVRRVGHIVRSSLRIDAATKMALGIQPQKRKATVLACPQEPPRLRFVRALHEGGAVSVHELAFSAMDFKTAKPAGAVRLELFFALVPPEAPIPAHPFTNPGAWPWYWQSYTRSPIRVIPPIPSVPMRIVYWGRWTDSMCKPGPFSATAAGWIEGGSLPALPGGVRAALPKGRPGTPPMLEVTTTAAPALRAGDERYIAVVVEAVSRTLFQHALGADDTAAATTAMNLPAPSGQRRLEGPRADDEADEAAAAA